MTPKQHKPSTGIARKLRRNETEAEKQLWRVLRARQFLGLKFRRQSPVAGFVADFLCEEMRIIVEADGGQHAESPSDERRTALLQAAGYHVIRYWNNDIMSNLECVLEDLRGRLAAISDGRPPHPTLSQGERAL
ncbi:endonuclease domain-containing protein [Sphingopyxis sp. UBA6723]|uniref:endonuclease domain-containing protein n=1 Tax=Sphingopyxis sp. UBA6723 TaxID=1947538 RepID=UPI0025E4FBBB|nr:endonuclease domain-containing protein [Sphingopyxis sp. UBA6723]